MCLEDVEKCVSVLVPVEVYWASRLDWYGGMNIIFWRGVLIGCHCLGTSQVLCINSYPGPRFGIYPA